MFNATVEGSSEETFVSLFLALIRVLTIQVWDFVSNSCTFTNYGLDLFHPFAQFKLSF
jgi:hypothetical protein